MTTYRAAITLLVDISTATPLTEAEVQRAGRGTRRTYAGLSHDGSYWHLIAPFAGAAGGELVCTCNGGRWHGRCWRLDQAIAFEAGDARQASHALTRPTWAGPDPRAELLAGSASFDAPLGAGHSVQAERG